MLRKKTMLMGLVFILVLAVGAAVIFSRGLNPDTTYVISGSDLKLDIPAASENVKDYGAKGDGVSDDTTAFQEAVDRIYMQGGGTVYIPDGIYLISPDISIELKDKTRLSMASLAVLKAKPSARENYAVIKILDADNVEIVGGKIIGERDEHLGITGEWGMGIEIKGSSNVSIADISVSDCWGDGIYVGSTSKQKYCENISIERFELDNNRRQGITVISARNLTIRDGTIANTHGTRPEAGIDLEPNDFDEFMQNILIENTKTINNAGYGIDMYLGKCEGSTAEFSLAIRKCADQGSARGAIQMDNIRYCQRHPELYNFRFELER